MFNSIDLLQLSMFPPAVNEQFAEPLSGRMSIVMEENEDVSSLPTSTADVTSGWSPSETVMGEN
jgi:hypothetical protein